MEIKLSKERLDQLAEESKNTGEFLLAVHAEVIPDWDKVEKVGHFPRANRKFNGYCLGIDADKFKKPLGAWFNNGFSSDESVPDWTVVVETEKIKYVENNNG